MTLTTIITVMVLCLKYYNCSIDIYRIFMVTLFLAIYRICLSIYVSVCKHSCVSHDMLLEGI